MTVLTTERLVLRPLELADAGRFAELARDPDVCRMTSSFPMELTKVGAEGWVLIRQAQAPLGRDHVFAITLPGDGIIGSIGAHLRSGEIEIGYLLGRPYWGRGYATEAVKALCSFAQSLKAGPVVAAHFADNPASGRVLAKAGFVYTGEEKMVFSLARKGRAATLAMRHAGRREALAVEPRA